MDSRYFRPTYPSPFTEQEKKNYLHRTCDYFLKRKFNLVNSTNFWISLIDEYPVLTKTHYEWSSHLIGPIYAKQDFLLWPSLKANVDYD